MMGSRSCWIFFALGVWYLQVPSEPGIRVHSAEDLESGFGDRIRQLGQEHPTGFLLCKALRRLESPVLVSDAIAGRWLRVYCGINARTKVDNAAHLERDWGDRIRDHLADEGIEPGALANWMLTTLEVSVPTRVCQAWLTRDWASSGKLLVCDAVEQQLGERLRLAEYKDSFADDAAAQTLSEVLLERQPPVRVSGLVLRQWYSKYHPDSGSLRYDSADALEQAMGDDLRRDYAGLGYKALRTALGKRRKVIEVSRKVCQTWVTQYGAPAPAAAAASGAASSSGIRNLVGAKAEEEAHIYTCVLFAIVFALSSSSSSASSSLSPSTLPSLSSSSYFSIEVYITDL